MAINGMSECISTWEHAYVFITGEQGQQKMMLQKCFGN